MGSKIGAEDQGTLVDIDERVLERYELPPGVARVKLWDRRLTGFGIVIGRRHCTFVMRAYVRGQGESGRHQVTLGRWAPSKVRAADEMVRAQTMTVKQARDAALAQRGAMRSGEDPTGAPGRDTSGPTFGEALAVHIDRLRRKGGQPRSIEVIERECAKHLGDWLERPLREITRTEARERHELWLPLGAVAPEPGLNVSEALPHPMARVIKPVARLCTRPKSLISIDKLCG